jgi:cytochrome d oxidase subunit CydB
MSTIWFMIVAVMVAIYVVLDGFDLGAGAVHLFIAKSDVDRRTVIRAIGPVWDGNEVWLLAAGGTLYFAFPQLYASGFSGFYLPLMMVLRYRHRIPCPRSRAGVAWVFRCDLRRFQHPAGHFLRGSAGQCRSRRSAQS